MLRAAHLLLICSGVLHRAFSVFILNEAGEVLLQQRAAGKRLWPRYWSNSCCSHPRLGESLEDATRRRLREELNLVCELQFVYKFEYRAQYDATGAEHELCSVYVGRTAEEARPNVAEIEALRWVAPATLQREMADPDAARFTPWFVLEWQRIVRDHQDALHALQAPQAAR